MKGSVGSVVTNTTVRCIGMNGIKNTYSEFVRRDTQHDTRMTRSAGRVAVETYVLDVLGRCVSTKTQEGMTRHVYDDNWQVIPDIDSQNNIVASWQYDAWGNAVDEAVSAPALASLRCHFQYREWSVFHHGELV